MAAKSRESESQDFLHPWKLSDVVLVVEEERLHVHRAVLAMWSPVFEKMFTSEFQEKDKNEVPLPGKKSSEVQELLLMIYPSVGDREEKEITEGNCYFLVKLAHEYQIDAIAQRCEDFIVKKMKTKTKDGALAGLMFAQTYKLEKLKRASIEQAYNLSLEELKKNELYNQIKAEDLKEIMEGIIKRLQSQLDESQRTSLERQQKIDNSKRVRSVCLLNVDEMAKFLVSHALTKERYSFKGCKNCTDTKGWIAALRRDEFGSCECGSCGRLDRASDFLNELRINLETLEA